MSALESLSARTEPGAADDADVRRRRRFGVRRGGLVAFAALAPLALGYTAAERAPWHAEA